MHLDAEMTYRGCRADLALRVMNAFGGGGVTSGWLGYFGEDHVRAFLRLRDIRKCLSLFSAPHANTIAAPVDLYHDSSHEYTRSNQARIACTPSFISPVCSSVH
jgi:hypothetical protein